MPSTLMGSIRIFSYVLFPFSSEPAQDKVLITSGKRKGLLIDLRRRKANRAPKLNTPPKDNAPPKYSKKPHPMFKLSRSALPREASLQDLARAESMLSCSVTRKGQTGYATAAKHYQEAEKALGRAFGLPPSPEEVVFLVNFLLGKEIKVETVRSYLSGIRFYLLSRGVSSPAKLPQLAEQLLLGKSKGSRNAVTAASKKERRAITLDMVVLLGHSISSKDSLSEYEKALLWSVCTNAWWGSLRLGEILPEFSSMFNTDSTLLGSDLKFSTDGSISFWLRNPKVWTSDTGSVVEVWPVPEKPEVDPVAALSRFMGCHGPV